MDRFQLALIDTALKNKSGVSISQLLSFWNLLAKANLEQFEEYLYVKKIHESMGRVKHDAYDAKRIVTLSETIGKYYTNGSIK